MTIFVTVPLNVESASRTLERDFIELLLLLLREVRGLLGISRVHQMARLSVWIEAH